MQLPEEGQDALNSSELWAIIHHQFGTILIRQRVEQVAHVNDPGLH
jgi:hypothetical protein